MRPSLWMWPEPVPQVHGAVVRQVHRRVAHLAEQSPARSRARGRGRHRRRRSTASVLRSATARDSSSSRSPGPTTDGPLRARGRRTGGRSARPGRHATTGWWGVSAGSRRQNRPGCDRWAIPASSAASVKSGYGASPIVRGEKLHDLRAFVPAAPGSLRSSRGVATTSRSRSPPGIRRPARWRRLTTRRPGPWHWARPTGTKRRNEARDVAQRAIGQESHRAFRARVATASGAFGHGRDGRTDQAAGLPPPGTAPGTVSLQARPWQSR